jgi:toxin ParE1/3/4
MAELRLTPEASIDLEEIVAYSVECFGQATADRYLRDFEAVFEILEQFPDSGSIYQGIAPPLRSMRCGSHRIFYKVIESALTVVRVLHFARDAKQALDNRH